MAETAGNAAIPACLLGWLIPGAGHLYLGRFGKGFVFLGAITALFVLGLAMQGRVEPYFGWDDPLSSLRSLAQMAIGGPYVVVRLLGLGGGQITSVTHEYGNTFTEVGGLLNIMVVIDAFDTALGRKA